MVGQGRQIWLGVDHEVGRKMMKVTEVVRGWKKRYEEETKVEGENWGGQCVSVG
jgi:hypothetical protein